MKIGQLFAGMLVLTAALPATAQLLSLNSDQGMQGIYRYCEYSNGKIYAFQGASSCPSSYQPRPSNGKGIGHFMGENHEGSSKQCVYRVGGQDRSIRVDTHAQCPLNYEF